MNARHRRTLVVIFARPTRANVKWRDVVSLLRGLGAEVDERRQGSRVAILWQGNVTVQQRPHPRPVMDRGAVAAMRDFLKNCDVEP